MRGIRGLRLRFDCLREGWVGCYWMIDGDGVVDVYV